ncbi:MAG: choloylglycine hydrolase [Faecalimonas sp.]|nr:choloylglycine hydrolase [Faecalimonas sp.]
MCTAFNLTTKDHYFGRNLDLDCSYGEEVCVMPRNFPLEFRKLNSIKTHYAMIGMALVVGDVPLFYDATNEHGLSMAGLNFPGNAYYAPIDAGKENVTPFEFIPFILGQCKTVAQARILLERINLVDIPFNEQFPLSPLHWMIDDRMESIVVESMKDGLHIHDNPVGVLTNNPPFEYHLFNLNHYRNLRVDSGENHFGGAFPFETYCQGLGALGLPGDVSSMSRFVRGAFWREHAVCEGEESSSVSQFFHLLSSVEMLRGVCLTDEGKWDITVYSACMNVNKGLYYYTTYDNRQIQCVDMHQADLDGTAISRYPLETIRNS